MLKWRRAESSVGEVACWKGCGHPTDNLGLQQRHVRTAQQTEPVLAKECAPSSTTAATVFAVAPATEFESRDASRRSQTWSSGFAQPWCLIHPSKALPPVLSSLWLRRVVAEGRAHAGGERFFPSGHLESPSASPVVPLPSDTPVRRNHRRLWLPLPKAKKSTPQ